MSATRAQLRAYFPDGRFGRRVHALPKYNCIYVRNAKAGSSTILLWLDRIHTGEHGFTPANIHRQHRLPRSGQDVPLSTIARMLGGDAFRFTFVRHPVARVESAYLNKIADPDRPQHRAKLRKLLGRPPYPDLPVTFEDFIAALEAQPAIEMDPHWRPQNLNLMHPLVEYDVVGRLENFDADLTRIRESARLPDVPVAVRNSATAPRRGSLFDGKADLLRRVVDIYADDFELFHYQ